VSLASRVEANRFANRIIDFYVCDGVRARCAADGRLIHQDDIVQKLRPLDLSDRSDRPRPLPALFLDAA